MTQPTFLPETWIDPRVELGESATHGRGLFTTELIRAGETVIIWGGTPYTEAELRAGKVPRSISYSFIDDGLLLAGPADGLDYYVNHACDPNIWMADQVTVVARRDIQPGEELRGDYAVWESEPEFMLAPCACGTALCRGTVTGIDWQRPELQERYEGHFLPFLNRRIAQMRGQR
ncbi:MAG TPA: SET domain-containing protein-lysine N-methyltransferase [Herpetosiphonaceae bacterium]